MFRWLGKLQKHITIAVKHKSTHQKNRIQTSYSRTNEKPIETTKPTPNNTLATTQHHYHRKQLTPIQFVHQIWTHHLLTHNNQNTVQPKNQNTIGISSAACHRQNHPNPQLSVQHHITTKNADNHCPRQKPIQPSLNTNKDRVQYQSSDQNNTQRIGGTPI
jgi:hypothetical protein